MEWSVLVIGLYLVSFQNLHGLRIPIPDDFQIETTKIEFLGTDRHRRDISTENAFPDRSIARFNIHGEFQEISLEKNDKIDIANIPVFMSRNGRPQRYHVPLHQEHAVYQSPDTGGSFLVTSEVNNTTQKLEIFGTFHHNYSLYVIQPRGGPDTQDEGHVISRVPEQKLVFESCPPKEVPFATVTHQTDRSNAHNGNQGNGRSRRELETYNVEIFSVFDFKSYTFWYDLSTGSNRHADAVQQIMQYLAYLINAVDMRFKTIKSGEMAFNILSAGVYVADTPVASPWSEDNVVDGQVSSSTALDDFTAWVNQQTSLPEFDHAMGFTGYDLVSSGSGDSSGIAYTDTLCSDDSTSIIEDNSFNFVTMTTAAHELGHSLGAGHDGIDNTCNRDNNYIMSAVNRVVADPVLGQQLWQFSTCSVQEFKVYIDKLNGRNQNCMLKTNGLSQVPTTLRPMAETYGPDQTCVYRFGEGSYVCRSVHADDFSTICTGMFCNQPGTSQCYSTIPAEGTPCGRGKWCHQGKCVTSALAPSDNTDLCALGDRPGLIDSTGKTCAQLTDEDPGNCYGAYTGANCCGSCNLKHTGDSSCEFGDHGRTFCSTMSRFGCYSNEQYCCSTCKQLKNPSLPGCEFGDKFNGCSKNRCPFYSAENLAGCCETCFDPSNTVKPPTTSSTSSTSSTTSSSTSTTTSTTSTTSTTTSTTTPTSTSTTTPSSTTPSTKKTTDKPDTTTSTNTTTPELVVTSSSPDGKISEMVLVAIGCGIGAVVMIILVVIVCVCLRRRKAKMTEANGGRKPSRDNAYDNIGFVAALPQKPHHPPPRRGSKTSTDQNVSNGSMNHPIHTISNGTIEHADGYMMPSSVTPATRHITTADGVQYTAPNKPKIKPLVPPNKPKKSAFAAPKASPDLNKQRLSKPVHYKRTSALSNSSTDTIERSESGTSFNDSNVTSIPLPDGYDSIGDIQKIPQNRRPTLPENHPESLIDSNLSNINLDSDKNKNNLIETSENSKKTNGHELKHASDTFNNLKMKVLPTLPPRPIPRVKSKQRRKEIDANSNDVSTTDNNSATNVVENDSRNNNNGYEEMDNVNKMNDASLLNKPPKKPVPRRQISTGNSGTEMPIVPTKKPIRPPLKPVPRRRTSSDNNDGAHLNLAFDNEQVEIQI